MNPEKLSTLRLLREGMGKTVNVLEAIGGDSLHIVRAHLPEGTEKDALPVLFLLTSLAFLEADPGSDVDGWTPADFLSHLRFDGGFLSVKLETVRGRGVFTEITLSAAGDLFIQTKGRGNSASRWLNYVQGRRYLKPVDPGADGQKTES